jgi:hypothetical protein
VHPISGFGESGAALTGIAKKLKNKKESRIIKRRVALLTSITG